MFVPEASHGDSLHQLDAVGGDVTAVSGAAMQLQLPGFQGLGKGPDACEEWIAPEHGELAVALSGGEDTAPAFLWPPTPESTPPSSPRTDTGFSGSHVSDHFALESQQHPLVSVLPIGNVAEQPVPLEFAPGSVWPMASTPAGCRVIQRALEVASATERMALVDQLKGHVWEAATSPHANHVLQKCIEVVPAERVQFILTELQGHAAAAAKHRYGCRVLERLIEHCPCEQTAGLVDEVLGGTPTLCRHAFANFVIQHILEHGTPAQRQRVAAILHADIQRLARHRVASHVVRCALVHCAPEDRQRLVQEMSSDAKQLADLMHHHCGSFVVREMRRADCLNK